MSLEPAVALLAGLLLLGQLPGLAPGFGVVLVVIAGIGATRAGTRAPAPRDDRHPGPASSDLPGGMLPHQLPVSARRQ
jgi:inner membrane transporter RhtA